MWLHLWSHTCGLCPRKAQPQAEGQCKRLQCGSERIVNFFNLLKLQEICIFLGKSKKNARFSHFLLKIA